MKSFLRGMLSRRGFQIGKYPAVPFSPLPVFDLAIEVLIAHRGPKLTFVQVGAFEGRFGDPMHKWIKTHPWRGILVEPQPEAFALLRKTYAAVASDLSFENMAIGRGNTIELFRPRLPDAGKPSSQASFSRRKIEREMRGTGASEIETLTVPVTTLDRLLERHGIANLDILQIDAEGADWMVLDTLDLTRTKPALIQLEHGHLSPVDINAVFRVLDAAGYKILFGGHQLDTIALHSSVVPSAA